MLLGMTTNTYISTTRCVGYTVRYQQVNVLISDVTKSKSSM